jgi:hypothetical protein
VSGKAHSLRLQGYCYEPPDAGSHEIRSFLRQRGRPHQDCWGDLFVFG